MTDGGEPYQQTSLVQVRIIVQDVNNIAPEFTQESYTEYIVENEPPGKYWSLTSNWSNWILASDWSHDNITMSPGWSEEVLI